MSFFRKLTHNGVKAIFFATNTSDKLSLSTATQRRKANGVFINHRRSEVTRNSVSPILDGQGNIVGYEPVMVTLIISCSDSPSALDTSACLLADVTRATITNFVDMRRNGFVPDQLGQSIAVGSDGQTFLAQFDPATP